MNWIDEANNDIENRRKIAKELTPEDRLLISRQYAAKQSSKAAIKNGNHNFQKTVSEGRHRNKPMTDAHKFAFSSAGGKAQLGLAKPASVKLAKNLNVEWTCEHCGKPGKGKGNFKKYGHDTGLCVSTEYFPKKSTVKEWNLIYDLIPNNVNISDKEIFKIVEDSDLKIKYSAINTFIKYSSNLILVKEGVKRSPINRPIYKKIETKKTYKI
tara:strand:+ start:22 stop:657 length:636 start_codon:yes stop_codon:yes gene_type:complete